MDFSLFLFIFALTKLNNMETIKFNLDMRFFLVYETDEWLSNDKRTFGGVYNTLFDAIDAIIKHCDKMGRFEGENDRKEMESELWNDYQTFGHEINYIIEPYKVGEWQIEC